MWTTVLATFCELTTNSNPDLIAFQQSMDDLNKFMATNELPDMLIDVRAKIELLSRR